MSLQVVNGYVCFNCADVALAKKDINPAHPPGSPSNPQGLTGPNPAGTSTSTTPGANGVSATGATNQTQSSPAVVFGGALAQTGNQPPQSQPQPGQNQVGYQAGAQVNVFA
jgi:hypothetical protein